MWRNLERAQADSIRASDRRAALPLGSSRATVTTANAKWANAAEHRDRLARQYADAFAVEVARLAYPLPPAVLSRYTCGTCGAAGVKLWRDVHDASRGWCAPCGCAHAGVVGMVDGDGLIESEISGRTDQLYSSKTGHNLLPWVPDADGTTWGYTSVPAVGVAWWRSLPTAVRP
jgi:hypothetical protein